MARIFRQKSDGQAEIALLKIAHLRFRAFHAKFGREPRIDEPLFFDESQDQPIKARSNEVQAQLARSAREAGVELEPVLSLLGLSKHYGQAARRSARGLSSRNAGRYHSRVAGGLSDGGTRAAWNRFVGNDLLHRRNRITPGELQTLSKISFLGEAESESDYLLILRIIRARQQD